MKMGVALGPLVDKRDMAGWRYNWNEAERCLRVELYTRFQAPLPYEQTVIVIRIIRRISGLF